MDKRQVNPPTYPFLFKKCKTRIFVRQIDVNLKEKYCEKCVPLIMKNCHVRQRFFLTFVVVMFKSRVITSR